MASSTNRAPFSNRDVWTSIKEYLVPATSAGMAIVPVFGELIKKSSLQKGLPIPHVPLLEGLMQGMKAAPTICVIVGGQMALQKKLNAALSAETTHFPTTLLSSTIVGGISAPALAIFNGLTLKLSVRESLRGFSLKQAAVIASRETGFVAGLSAAEPLATLIKTAFHQSKEVDYIAAYASGVFGSLAGHPADTYLTRSQGGLLETSLKQSLKGAARRANAVGLFSVIYTIAKETLALKV